MSYIICWKGHHIVCFIIICLSLVMNILDHAPVFHIEYACGFVVILFFVATLSVIG